ncbi:MAG: hypothetical protein HWD61_11125 [Parachlamydiaceae bacterium]|nr:MAG: hypothetical protein HWD61_11125 [Parachlamydiaceae bacterium]
MSNPIDHEFLWSRFIQVNRQFDCRFPKGWVPVQLEEDFLHSYVLTSLIVLRKFKSDHPRGQELVNRLNTVPLPSVGIENKEVLEILKTFIKTDMEGNIEPIHLKAKRLFFLTKNLFSTHL